MKLKKRWPVLVLAGALLAALAVQLNPILEARIFVALHGEELERAILEKDPPTLPVLQEGDFTTWTGEHTMEEFLLTARGSTYYGVYYSHDDVPLAFQNTSVKLTQNGHAYWVWTAEGDNHGATQRLREHWYYFEAHF
ncbi:MAG: hypothetical protein Q4F17_08005 [Eubacteriales bacterium]|nr:hypothetical protein [Eubacteriales bacterium]